MARKAGGLGLLLTVLVVIGLLDASIFLFTGFRFAAPAPQNIGAPPPDLALENLEIQSTSGSLLHGWLARGRPGKGVVVLLHGFRSDRRVMVDRIRFLAPVGYTVLAPDFQAHGESPGKHITFGYLEALDAAAVVEYAHKTFPDEKIAVIGVSMGGAALLLAPRPLPIKAVILESVFPTISDALAARLAYSGSFGKLLRPMFLCLLPLLGFDADAIRPVEHIGSIGVPVFLIAGTLDRFTAITEARAFFDRAMEPKQFWPVEGAGHDDFSQLIPAEYQRRVLDFLDKNLNDQTRESKK